MIVFENETMSLSKLKDGFWLWDETRSMNLAIREKTERIAFIEAIEYYQRRLKEVEEESKRLHDISNKFVKDFEKIMESTW